MKPLDLVRVREECKKHYEGCIPTDEQFVFMGDINQMPGHGVFIVMGSGKLYAGFHTDSFEVVLTGDEDLDRENNAD